MNPLPLTVISGYLGAGKTTLINKILAGSHGLRLLVMVNDFGAINIDQTLIAAQSKEVIALTNGCVCCTMGADLFLALSDALDRRPRPDHLIIEASGIADPKAIANTAIAEPDLRYSGIVTLVDALNIKDLLQDTLVAPQVTQQISVADLVIQTKRDSRDPKLDDLFLRKGLQPPDIIPPNTIEVLLFAPQGDGIQQPTAQHPPYVSWHNSENLSLDYKALEDAIKVRPEGIYRIKGFVRTERGTVELHCVGKQFDIKILEGDVETSLVAIGLRDRIVPDQISEWWQSIPKAL